MVNTVSFSVSEFNEEISKNHVSIVDFSATWCGPCRMMAPIVEECSEKYKDKYNFYQVDIDENEELAKNFGIMYVPTFIIFYDGKEIARDSGYHPSEEFEKFINDSLSRM